MHKRECKYITESTTHIGRIEASTVKFFKRKKVLDRKNLFELVQNDLYRFFKIQLSQIEPIIELLIQKEYCKTIEK